MQGSLFIVGTPIGNLGDMTFRGVETLKSVSLIACEDTRHTLKLLNHFEIKTPLISYHEHSGEGRNRDIIDRVLSGQDVALVSDAGMPLVSDPGSPLIRLAALEGVSVKVVPSGTAFVSGLCLSGLDMQGFLFLGFLPRAKKERIEILNRIKSYPYTLVFYESPHHLKRTLSDFLEFFGDREAACVREITKRFEETIRLPLSELASHFDGREPVGEFVVLVSGASLSTQKQEQVDFFRGMDINDHMSVYVNKGFSKKEAMKLVARDRGVSKSVVYGELLE